MRGGSVAVLFGAALVLSACGDDTTTTVTVVWPRANFSVAVEPDLKYGEGETRAGANVDLLMDVYTPAESTASRRPAMIIVHGGAWASGDKANAMQVELANFYASRGFVACSINYRMTGDDPADVPQRWLDTVGLFLDEPTQRASYAAMVDTATAVRFVRANAAALGVAPDHIFSEGSSAGAFNVVHVGLDDPALYASALPVNNLDESSSLQIVIDRWGGFFHRSEVDADDPPVLILHGTADPIVPFVLGQLLDESLTAAGVAHQFVPLDGAGHSAWDATAEGKTLNEIALEFIAMHGGVRMEFSEETDTMPQAGFVSPSRASR